MSAMQEKPPAVARQRVKRALRQFRERTPLSQGDVAKKLGWSLSKMQRIESAEVAVSQTDLRALLDVYGVDDARLVSDLSREAQTARRQRWVTPPEYREHLTAGMRQLLQFESQATTIRAYQSFIIPGILQTPAVARTVLGWDNNNIDDDQRRVRYDIRMQRRRHVLEGPAAPQYSIILDEAVIKRHLGTPADMAELLESMTEVARQPNVHIRILPFDRGARMGLVMPFQILGLSGDPDDVVAYRESYDDDAFIDDPAAVRKLGEIFDELWNVALSEVETADRIVAEVASLRARMAAELTGTEGIDTQI